MNRFAMNVKFTTQPGRRDELTALLLDAAEQLQALEDCLSYVVSVANDDPDTVWVTELWTSESAHAASLEVEGAEEMIARARPLIAGVAPVRLRPIGGKGL